MSVVAGLDELARRIKRDGFRDPVFVPGWQTRGLSALRVKGSMFHWTAGPRSGNAPSLNIVTHGRPGLANALCNTYTSREPRLYIVAARLAYHAGAGSWRGVSGNVNFLGHEAECSGPGDWSQEHIALTDAIAYHEREIFDLDLIWILDHYEYTSRKIDCNDIGGPKRRSRVSAYKGQAPSPGNNVTRGGLEMLLFRWHEDRGGVKSTPHVVGVYGGVWTRIPGGSTSKYGAATSALNYFVKDLNLTHASIPPILPIELKERAPGGYVPFGSPGSTPKKTWHIGPDPRK